MRTISTSRQRQDATRWCTRDAEASARVPRQDTRARADSAQRILRAFAAWLCLHGVSLSLAVFGFDLTCRMATRGLRARPAMTSDAEPFAPAADLDAVVADVTRSLTMAKRLHLRSTVDDCLPVALTGACLLRWYGLNARLILGVKGHPFLAHAWVEVDDRVIDFPPAMYKGFLPIDMSRHE
jgi:hypothetical protein